MRASRGARAFFQWLVLGGLVGAVCGVASAVFLYLLDVATHFRQGHPNIVFTLPVAGLVIGALYGRWGTSIRGGNNLILDTVHEGDKLQLRIGHGVRGRAVQQCAPRAGTAPYTGAAHGLAGPSRLPRGLLAPARRPARGLPFRLYFVRLVAAGVAL